MKVSHICLFAIFYVLAQATASSAEQKEILTEASYTMGDGETPVFAEAMVLQKAKQMALEQAGTYAHSHTKLNNLDLTSEQITTIAGGVLQTEVLKKERSLVGDGVRFDIMIKAIVTTDRMEELARKLRGDDMAQEYKRLREEYAGLMRDLNTLKASIAERSAGPEYDAALEEIRERERRFLALQKIESGFFEKLISGEALFAKALSQVSKKESEKDIADEIFARLLESGITVTLGEPDAHTSLKHRKFVRISIPVTLTTTPEIKTALVETAHRLHGTVVEGGFQIIFTPVKGTAVKLGSDPETVAHFQRRVSSLTLILEARTGATSTTCYLAPDYHRFGRSGFVGTLGIIPGSISPAGRKFFPDNLYRKKNTLEDSEGFVLFNDSPVSFKLEMPMALQSTKGISSLVVKVIERVSEQGAGASSVDTPKCGVSS